MPSENAKPMAQSFQTKEQAFPKAKEEAFPQTKEEAYPETNIRFISLWKRLNLCFKALNFGEIGTVIGHEIGHGFDDDGSEYDKDGNIINWWSKETKEEFSKKADCFRKQYASYVEPTTNLSLNGKGTVGENIGDNGGIRNVFLAYKTKKFRPRQRQSDEVHNKRLPGVSATPDQLFFLGYAMVWCAQERTQSMELSIQYSSHTPNKFRVNVPLSNSEGFAKVFNCPSGSPMNPVSKCVLW